jgi:acyl-CoA dehydrogenase
VSISPIAKLGRNAVRTCEVVYEDLEVNVDDRVGEEGEGFRYLLDGLNAERVLIAAEALGIGRAALRRGVAYANERVVFDRPIGKNQGVSFPLAIAKTQLDAAELMIRKAAYLIDEGKPCAAEANMAKYLAAEAGFFAADAAVQTHGGFGYAREFHVERYWREARLMKLAPISQEMILNFVSEHVLGMPRSY